ncbi:uncharacterized protein LOC135846555 isoform X2 [Planococcus citri]|uniref:uncharacterized protein LOC135846555 isoform X2 n=1 Tax=Planococcus citri TaxID=170843 RepID=UPI0031FA119E
MWKKLKTKFPSKKTKPITKMEEVKMIESGFTTQLKSRIKDKIEGHPLWGSQCLLTDPTAVIDTHREYVRSGVDILITNTYQASIQGFKKYLNLDETQSFELIKQAVQNCHDAIAIEKSQKTIDHNKKHLIAGAIGSFGAYLADGSEYNGNYIDKYNIDYIRDWHRPRIQALVEGGVDIIAFETLPVQKEAEMLVQLVKEFPNVKAWLSFSGKDERHIAHGEEFQQAALKCWSLNPDQLIAIGVNCTESRISTELLSTLVGKNVPMIVYPNAGQIWDGKNKVWKTPENIESVDQLVEKWCDMGVKYIGGCCGTTMETRRFMRKVIDEYNARSKSSTN